MKIPYKSLIAAFAGILLSSNCFAQELDGKPENVSGNRNSIPGTRSNVDAYFYGNTTSAIQLPVETEEQYQQRMKWWKDEKYGMFIHWGLYAVLSGYYNGVRTPSIPEWIQNTLHIPLEEYKKLVSQFNPVKFNADDWARLAKAAGMKYVVLTAKHHDGFALFDSKVTTYDIAGTPYKKDVVKALKEACHKQGLKFGLYYSHNIDWEHPQNAIRNGGKRNWNNLTDFKPEEMNKDLYLKEKAYPQLKELLTNYGKIDILWFDMGTGLNSDEVRSFVKICKDLQPEILISSRVGAEVAEKEAHRDMLFDFYTPDDNFFTGDDLPMAWEMVGTTNGSWGYRKDDTHWRTPKMILSSLLACASRNGNYMLNMGPMPNGLMPPEATESILKVGNWLERNGEALYYTKGSPFAWDETWGYVTQKPGKLYLNITQWPENNRLYVKGLLSKPVKITLLGDDKALPFEHKGSSLSIPLSGISKVELATTIVATFESDKISTTPLAEQGEDKNIALYRIDGHYDASKKLSAWTFKVHTPGRYRVTITSNEKGSHSKPEWTGADQQGALEVAEQTIPVKLNRDEEKINATLFFYKEIQSHIGQINLPRAGIYTLRLKNFEINARKWNPGLFLDKIELKIMGE
ncbi:alpha-L-fucosidase [Pedobacter nyackensis]|uniref:alpha-L-fucosidase n=1 Tax=Pedobacter nyackensis TaxID=475255 RepID=UPI002931CC47|nr:alpha-L-fucosidase [Pedobacter nyackensis]